MNRLSKFLTSSFKKWTGTKEKSSSVTSIGDIFNKDEDVIAFYNSVSSVFHSFDESNRSANNAFFPNDIWYIMKYTIESLELEDDSSKFSTRTDSYFYVYRRIVEYLNYIPDKHTKEKLSQELAELRAFLYDELAYVFYKTMGEMPNVLIQDRSALERINIYEHLMMITTIQDDTELDIFFVLYKLALQSSLICDDHRDYSWVNILSHLQSINLPLEFVISKFIDYKQVLTTFPLDIPDFINLIEKTRVETKTTIFSTYISLVESLNLDAKIFLDKYLPHLPNWMAQNKKYRNEQIADLLQHVSQWEELFVKYLPHCASHMSTDLFWKVSLNLIANLNFSDTMLTHMSLILLEKSNSLYINGFINIINPVINTQTTLNDEKFSNLMKILQTVFDGFVSDLFVTDVDPYKIEDKEWLDLYNTAHKLSQVCKLPQPPSLIIINRLLFNFGHKGSVPEKILFSFRRIKSFNDDICKENDPKEIIKDEWLTEYTLPISSMCFDLTKSNYEDLRYAYRDHPWNSYVWSRIIHLSILKSTIKDPADILSNIVDWIKRVGHNIYRRDDTLTIVFVNTIFETIIMKHINATLLTPNIEPIMNFILQAYYDDPCLINKNYADEFVQKAQQWIRNIFLLRGKAVDLFFNLTSDTIKELFRRCG